jgi:hypothetical protein
MEVSDWHRVDPVDVPAEGRVRRVTGDGRTVALARCGARLGALEHGARIRAPRSARGRSRTAGCAAPGTDTTTIR